MPSPRCIRRIAAVTLLVPQAALAQQYLTCASDLKQPPPAGQPAGQSVGQSGPLGVQPNPAYDWDGQLSMCAGVTGAAGSLCSYSRALEGVIGRRPSDGELAPLLAPSFPTPTFWSKVHGWVVSHPDEMGPLSDRIATAVYGRPATLLERTAWTGRILTRNGFYLAIVDSLRRDLTGPVEAGGRTSASGTGGIATQLQLPERGALVRKAFLQVYGRDAAPAERAAVPTCNGFAQVLQAQRTRLYAGGNESEVLATVRRAWQARHRTQTVPTNAQITPFIQPAVAGMLTYVQLIGIVQ
jgi:hypothetical protein